MADDDLRVDSPVSGGFPPPSDDPPRSRHGYRMPIPEDPSRRRAVSTGRRGDLLLRLTWMLVHGERGLTPSVRKNLATAAYLLVTLWVVDVLAWFGLGNLLLNGSIEVINPISALALALALLGATAILFYESSFITADLYGREVPWFSISVRAVLIVAMAWVGSVPVDMYLLKDQIDRRLHEEEVLKKLPQLVRHWADAQEAIKGGRDTDQAEITAQTVAEQQGVEAAADLRHAREQELRVIAENRRQQGRVVERLTLARAQGEPRPAVELDRLAQAIGQAQRQHLILRAQEERATQALRNAESEANEREMQLKQKMADVNRDRIVDASADSRRWEQWIHDLWNAPPLSNVKERNVTTDPEVYEGAVLERRIGLGERMIALSDVLSGAPPRRPRMSTEDQERLRAMNLTAFVEADPEAIARQQSEAASLRRLIYVVSGVFLFFPALIMALKFMFDADTKAYLSSSHQRAGHPDLSSAASDYTPLPD